MTAIISEQSFQNFSAYFPTFVKRVLEDEVLKDLTPFDRNRLREMLEYNLPYGYRRIPYFMLSAYNAIHKNKNITEEKLDLVNLMAWCIHLIQWSYQILDDMADDTDTRANRLCWYKRKDVGINAIFDGMILNCLIPNLLKRYFSGHKHYHDMIDTLNQVNMMSVLGQRLDLDVCPWTDITLHRWKMIAYNKTAWHQSVISFKFALYLTQTYEADKYRIMEPILMDFGLLLQMTNDYLDAFPIEGLPEVNPTDIQEGKCSWLLVHALKLCNPSQRSVIQENYRRQDGACIKKVLDVYRELGLKEFGENFRKQLYQNIVKRIDELPDDYPKTALKCGLVIGYKCY